MLQIPVNSQRKLTASQDLAFNNQQVVSVSGTVLPEVVVKPSGLKKKSVSKLCGFSEEEKVGGEDTSKTIIYHLQEHQEVNAQEATAGVVLFTWQKIQQSQMFKILQ